MKLLQTDFIVTSQVHGSYEQTPFLKQYISATTEAMDFVLLFF